VKKLFNLYRPLAYIVGVLLLLGTIFLIGKYALSDGSSLQHFCSTWDRIVFTGHGFIYIVYVIVAFVLSRQAGWTLRFLAVLLIAGLVPGLIFWVERLVEERVRPWIAEEEAAAQMSSGNGAVSGS
jgi:integral membrane protein